MSEKQTTFKESQNTNRRGAAVVAAGALMLTGAAGTVGYELGQNSVKKTQAAPAPESVTTIDPHVELLRTADDAAEKYAVAIEALSVAPTDAQHSGALQESIEKNSDITLSYSVPAASVVGDGSGEYVFQVRTHPSGQKSEIDPTHVSEISIGAYTDSSQSEPTMLYSFNMLKSDGEWLVNESIATKGPERITHNLTTGSESNGRTSFDGVTLGNVLTTADMVLQQAIEAQPTGLVDSPWVSPK